MTDLKVSQRVTAKDPRGRAETRHFAFSHVAITETTVATAQAVISSADNEVLELTALNVSHIGPSGGASASVTLCIATDGATPISTDEAMSLIEVPAGEFIRFGGALMLNPNQTLFAFADSANKLKVSGWVTAYL